MRTNRFTEEWILVGKTSTNSLLVCGGEAPISIKVSHSDCADLLKLVADANAGIAARRKIGAK